VSNISRFESWDAHNLFLYWCRFSAQESLNYYFHSCDLDILGLCLCVCEGDEAAATWLQFISFIWRISYLHVHPDINVGNYGQLHTFVLATQYSVIIIKEKK
jgi:hypothetical protein